MQEVMTYDFAKYLDIGTESTSDIKLMNVGHDVTTFCHSI